jgi:hypothetical protein
MERPDLEAIARQVARGYPVGSWEDHARRSARYALSLEAGLEELLDVAERIRGGDTKLDPERWYAARDFARSLVRRKGDQAELENPSFSLDDLDVKFTRGAMTRGPALDEPPPGDGS